MRGWKWDCPSCGADKRRFIVDAGEAQGARRIVTATFPQPQAFWDGWDLSVPDEFALCDPETHCYVYRDGTTRWRVLPSCALCLTRVSAMLTQFRKRIRRKYPAAQVLRVYEKHKSGALHVHMLWSGLPWKMTRNSPAAMELKDHWAALGGGWLDLGYDARGVESARRAAAYAAKYVTKGSGIALAQGYRLWTRSQGFSPHIRMPGSHTAALGPSAGPFRPQTMIGGWLRLHDFTIVATREAAGAAAAPT